jgi:hypothetical protein
VKKKTQGGKDDDQENIVENHSGAFCLPLIERSCVERVAQSQVTWSAPLPG